MFSDVVMPGMSGVELARIAREHWPDLPVILTSGYSVALATDSGHGFQLLRKPIRSTSYQPFSGGRMLKG